MSIETLLKSAKQDIEVAIDVWKKLLQENFGKNISYAYVKGSGIKNWNSLVDYVPILSDLDIHVKLKKNNLFSESKSAFDTALELSCEYETQFLGEHQNLRHIPRMQVMIINDFFNDVQNYIPPRKIDVQFIIKNVDPRKDEFSSINTSKTDRQRIRAMDYANLIAEEEFLSNLPMTLMDRTGLDYWSLIRRMTWRVSPSPIRLLTQIDDDVLNLWSMNRTKIIEKLNKNGFKEIVDHYKSYYETGWKIFLSDFKNNQYYRDLINYGYKVLKSCLNEIKKL